jgi:hypothetical protein
VWPAPDLAAGLVASLPVVPLGGSAAVEAGGYRGSLRALRVSMTSTLPVPGGQAS